MVTGPTGSAIYAVVPAADSTGAIDMRHHVVTGSIAGGTPIVAVPPSAAVHDLTVIEGDAGTTSALVPLTLSWPSDHAVLVAYATTAGTAKTPDDFSAVAPTTVTFAAGETAKTIAVPIVGDAISEKSEKLTVKLSSPVGVTLGDSAASLTVLDNDAPLSVRVADAAVTEGNAGSSNLDFTVTLSAPAPAGQTTTVTVATANASAIAPSDYAALGTTVLTFAAGETTKTVSVAVAGDGAVEKNETFSLKLSQPVGLVLADTTGVGTIVNDDGPSAAVDPLPSVFAGDVTVAEGNSATTTVPVPVTLSQASATPVVVTYATVDVTAAAPGDYTAIPATTLTFAPGETTKSIPVSIVGDGGTRRPRSSN